MYLKHLTSLEFLAYLGMFAVAVASVWSLVPGRAPPARDEPYSGAEIGSHDRKLAKYFVAGGAFLVLGSLHMVVKNPPPVAQGPARRGDARRPPPAPPDTPGSDGGGGAVDPPPRRVRGPPPGVCGAPG